MSGDEDHDQDGDKAARVRRLRFRAWRRGFKEADLLLGCFADAHAAELSPEELAQFEALLEESDHDVYAWALEAAPPPARHDHALFARLKAFCRNELSAQPRSGS